MDGSNNEKKEMCLRLKRLVKKTSLTLLLNYQTRHLCTFLHFFLYEMPLGLFLLRRFGNCVYYEYEDDVDVEICDYEKWNYDWLIVILDPGKKRNLPALGTLFLNEVYLSDKAMERILSGCPFLEDLSVVDCYVLGNLNPENPDLKKLMLSLQVGSTRVSVSCSHVVSIEGGLNV